MPRSRGTAGLFCRCGAGSRCAATCGGRTALVVIAKIGHVPARTLELKSGGGDLFDVTALLTFRAVRQNRVRHFLKNILLVSTSRAFIRINWHNTFHKQKPKGGMGAVLFEALILAAFYANSPPVPMPLYIPAGSRNMAAAITVGIAADSKSFNGEIAPSGKHPFKIANPAGFGAFAITVRPPPVTAPATSM